MFKKRFDFERRLSESTRIRERYPDRVPIIIERAGVSKGEVDDLSKHKYLVPNTTSVLQLQHIIRKRIPNLDADKSIFLFVKDTVMPPLRPPSSRSTTSTRTRTGSST